MIPIVEPLGAGMFFAKHRIWSFFIVSASLLLIGLINTIWLGQHGERAFLLTLALNALVVSIIGAATTGFAYGILIDNRNRVSLSRFQVLLWTILVFSAVVTAAAINIQLGRADALELAIPGQLLAAIGISTISAVATPAILATKSDKVSPAAAVDETAQRLGVSPDKIKAVGQLFSRVDAADAALADMFRGEEVGDAATADIGKIQQFIVTMLLVAVYGAAAFSVFAKMSGISGLPPLSDNFVWLFGISHAGYLTSKAVPRPTN